HGMLSAQILLRNEASGAQRFGMVRAHRRVQLAHQRQRAGVAAPGLCAAGRIASDPERSAAPSEITRIWVVLSDLPHARETNAVRVKETAIALPIGSPAQIGMRIDRALGRLAKEIRTAERQDAAEHAPQGHVVDWPGRFTGAPPDLLIGVGEDRAAYL